MRTLFSMTVLSLVIAAPVLGAEPSIAEAQADFQQGKYPGCLQKVAAILVGSEARQGSPGRYDLFLLRGECLLQMKRADLAADAFDAAARSVKGENDLKRVAPARAMAILIKSSANLAYRPKGASAADAIDIVNPELRKKALEALLQDRLKDMQPQVDEALKATTLPPMAKTVPALLDAFMIELAATGDTKQSLPVGQSVGEHARGLIENQLQRISMRVDDLYDLASEPTLSSGPREFLGPRGLTTPERDELKAIANELIMIKQVAQDGRRINRSIGGTGDMWDAVIVQVNDCEERTQRAYDRKY